MTKLGGGSNQETIAVVQYHSVVIIAWKYSTC